MFLDSCLTNHVRILFKDTREVFYSEMKDVFSLGQNENCSYSFEDIHADIKDVSNQVIKKKTKPVLLSLKPFAF